jgi:hypothetical protein
MAHFALGVQEARKDVDEPHSGVDGAIVTVRLKQKTKE